MLFSSNKIDVFALKKDNYISISLDNSLIKIKSYKKNVNSANALSNSISTSEIDIGSLFNNVRTKKIDNKKVKKKNNNKRFQEIQKRVKTVKNNDVKEISKIIKDINSETVSNKNLSDSTAKEVNEYFAKIQALVYTYFDPPTNSVGNIVKVVIELDPYGKLIDFRVLVYSDNEALNNEANQIKARLKNVIFPKGPNNKKRTIMINLIPDEKE